MNSIVISKVTKFAHIIAYKLYGIIIQITKHSDGFISFKNGYSFWKNLGSFGIAALLLIVLSIPSDNPLLKLTDVLQRRSWLLLPAVVLTFVCAIVYSLTIYAQIRKQYLWKDHDVRRVVFTSLFYITLCSLMAYAVLWSFSSGENIIGKVWPSLLVALLSLTGIGWSLPNSWVESIGINYPDYTDGRQAAAKLTEILQRVRKQRIGSEQDVKDFLKATQNLHDSIEKNLDLEPKWVIKDNLTETKDALLFLLDEVKEKFSTNDEVKYFAVACRCQNKYKYRKIIEKFNTLGKYWSEWKCPNKGG